MFVKKKKMETTAQEAVNLLTLEVLEQRQDTVSGML
jgi:hypothetical protein